MRISALFFANLFKSYKIKSKNLENHLNQYNPGQRQRIAHFLFRNIILSRFSLQLLIH
jgi:hypothetical protein